MMLKTIIYAALIITVQSLPKLTGEDTDLNMEKSADENDSKLVAYIQRFKEVMMDYVKIHNKKLTTREIDAIKNTVEDFLHNFARDLKDIVNGKHNVNEIDLIVDGLPDKTFEDVKRNIKNELPYISDEAASLIVYRLRKNLMDTRHKIDQIVIESQKSLENNN